MNRLWYLTRDSISPLLAALLGSYLLAWGVTTLGISALVASGVSFHSAETGLLLLAFPVCLAGFLWAFASRHRYRLSLMLAAAGSLMTAAGWQLQALILP